MGGYRSLNIKAFSHFSWLFNNSLRHQKCFGYSTFLPRPLFLIHLNSIYCELIVKWFQDQQVIVCVETRESSSCLLSSTGSLISCMLSPLLSRWMMWRSALMRAIMQPAARTAAWGCGRPPATSWWCSSRCSTRCATWEKGQLQYKQKELEALSNKHPDGECSTSVNFTLQKYHGILK